MKSKLLSCLLLSFLWMGSIHAQCGDDCATATVLTVDTTGSCTPYPCTNLGATPSSVSSFPCSAVNNNDVWFTFIVPPGYTNIAILVQGYVMSNPITYVYRGSCASLSAIGCINGMPPLSSSLFTDTTFVPGEQIWVRVKPLGGTPDGTFGICVYVPCPIGGPVNDEPCSATFVPMAGCSSYTLVSNKCATPSLGIPPAGCSSAWNSDIWIKSTVSPGGVIEINFQQQTVPDVVCAAYTGTCSALTLVGCDDDLGMGNMPYLRLNSLTPGDTAWIRISSAGTSPTGNTGICLNDPCPTGTAPVYDAPCSALVVPVVSTCSGYTSLTTACATPSDSTVPPPGCSVFVAADIWVQTTVSASGFLEVNFAPNSGPDIAAAIYTGSCTALALVACNDNYGAGNIPWLTASGLTPGSTAWVRIWVPMVNQDGNLGICLTDHCTGGGPEWAFDDPPCPLPNLTTSYAPVEYGTCNYILYSSFCTTNSFTSSPSGIPLPSGCSGPFYPPVDTNNWDLWVPFIIPDTPLVGTVEIRTMSGSIADLDMGVYTLASPVDSGCSIGSAYTLFGCDDLSGPGFMPYMQVPYGGASSVHPGDTLLVRCWGYNGGPNGTWYMCFSNTCTSGNAPPPASDDPPCPAAATNLPVTIGTCISYTTGDNLCATATTDPGNPGCANWTNSPDVWYTVAMPATGMLEINFQAGNLSDLGLAVYSGSAVSCGGPGFTMLACDDDGGPGLLPYASLNNPSLAGDTIYIRVWGFGTSRGSFGICVSTPCFSGIVDPPLFDNPPCPMPDSSSSYVNVQAGQCPVYSLYDISCADSAFSNIPAGMVIPGNCSPNYPATGASGRDVWIPMILPDTPSAGYLDVSVLQGTIYDPDIALYSIASPINSNCSNGAQFILDTCADRNTTSSSMPKIHLPYGGPASLQQGDTVLLRMWTHNGQGNGTWSMAARVTDWPLQEICLVTVNNINGRNTVVWEQPASSAVDSLIIQRENGVPGLYQRMGIVDATTTGVFTDASANPQTSAYRYGITIKDTCGQESGIGPTHKTMHLSVAPASVGWTLSWNNYEGFTYPTFYILRGITMGSLTVIDSVPFGQTTYTDTMPVVGSSFYAIEIRRPVACVPYPGGGTYGTSRSNVVYEFTVGISPVLPSISGLNIFPNPVTHHLEITFHQSREVRTSIRILDLTGREITTLLEESMQPGMHTIMWDVTAGGAAVANGIYFIRIESNGFSETRKIVVLR